MTTATGLALALSISAIFVTVTTNLMIWWVNRRRAEDARLLQVREDQRYRDHQRQSEDS